MTGHQPHLAPPSNDSTRPKLRFHSSTETPEGKRRCRLNTYPHGLTGQFRVFVDDHWLLKRTRTIEVSTFALGQRTGEKAALNLQLLALSDFPAFGDAQEGAAISLRRRIYETNPFCANKTALTKMTSAVYMKWLFSENEPKGPRLDSMKSSPRRLRGLEKSTGFTGGDPGTLHAGLRIRV
jgi:hypothetical protein